MVALGLGLGIGFGGQLSSTPSWLPLFGTTPSNMAIDFVNDRAWNGITATIASLLTCSRGSPATTYYTKADGTLTSFAANALRYGDNGLLVEQSATNLCLQASDFTQAAWTLSTMTAAKTATGPDGVTNSASTLTATAGNATALQAITSGSSARITSVYIKRRTGTGNIDVTQDNGSTWATQSVTATWTRFSIASVTSTNPTVGIRIVTNGDAVDVWIMQHEATAFITSPIPTVGSTVARSADTVSMLTSAISGFSATAGSFFFQGQKQAAGISNKTAWAISDTTLAENVYATDNAGNTAFVCTDGGVTQASMNKAYSDATLYKSAGAWALNDFSFVVNGGAASTDTSGTLPTVTTLFIGAEARGNQGYFCGNIKQVAYLNARASDANLITLST